MRLKKCHIKFVLFFLMCSVGFSATSIFYPIQTDTLSVSEKQQLREFVEPVASALKKGTMRIGLVTEGCRTSDNDHTVQLITTFLHDSLGISKKLLSKHASFVPTLYSPHEEVRPLGTVELLLVTPKKKQPPLVILDSSHVKKDGDTLRVLQDGYCLIRFNNTHRITVHQKSSVVVNRSVLRILEGEVTIAETGQGATSKVININTNILRMQLRGDANIKWRDSSDIFVSVYRGDLALQSPFTPPADLSAGQGAHISLKDRTVDIVELPKMPKMSQVMTTTIIPGYQTHFKIACPPKNTRRTVILSGKDGAILLDTICPADSVSLVLPYEQLIVAMQNIDSHGFVSPWEVKDIAVERGCGILSFEIFSDTSFFMSDDRPFTYRGVADTSVEVLLNGVTLPIDSETGAFSHSVMLQDSTNMVECITQYCNGMVDTMICAIYYNGNDERIFMNDTIMKRPAFTTTRSYRWEGRAPTATALKINGEEVKLGSDGRFKKRLKVRAFEEYPVILDITYENGHQKTIHRTLTRERYANAGEQGFKELTIGLLVVAVAVAIAIFVSENADN